MQISQILNIMHKRDECIPLSPYSFYGRFSFANPPELDDK